MAKSAPVAARNKLVGERIEREFRLYRIVAGNLGDTCKAVAYLGNGGARPVETVEAASIDDAVTRLMDVLAARLAEMRASRINGIPTAAEFQEALAALPAPLREKLRFYRIDALDRNATGSPLATLSMRTKTGPAAIVDDLRKIGRKLGELLDGAAAPGVAPTPATDLAALAGTDTSDGDGLPLLKFHATFCEALAQLPPERTAVMVGRR